MSESLTKIENFKIHSKRSFILRGCRNHLHITSACRNGTLTNDVRMKENFSMKKKLKVEINLNSIVKLKRYHFGKIKALF